MLFYLIQTNVINVIILIFLYIFLLTNQTIERQTVKLFFLAGLIVNILTVADMLDYYYASFSAPVLYRYITSATGYTLRPCIIISILLDQRKYKKQILTRLFIPFFINAAVAYSSIYTHWMFYFDNSNKFFRGPLGLLPFLLSGYYLLVVISWGLQRFRLGDKRESAVLMLIALMAVFAVVMESIFKFKFIVNGVGATSIVFYYLFLHTQTFKRDALTHALNRHSFYTDRERLQNVPMTIISVDMNDLKKINDRFGHNAGDKALCTITDEISQVLEPGAVLYRTGGDEFMLLCPKMSRDEAVSMISAAEKSIKEKGYSIAWGLAEYDPSDDIDKAISLSDERMYERKKQIKSQLE